MKKKYCEIVMCKECKHGDICKDDKGKDVVECFKFYCGRKPDWFCADGERKDDKQDV